MRWCDAGESKRKGTDLMAKPPDYTDYSQADADELARQADLFDATRQALIKPWAHPKRDRPDEIDLDAPSADDPNFGDYNLPAGGNHP